MKLVRESLNEAGGTPTIKSAMEEMGYTVNSTETTKGARKYWFTKIPSKGPKDFYELANYLKLKGVKATLHPDDAFTSSGPEITGDGWILQHQGNKFTDVENLFLAIYKNRPRGEEYFYGLDV